MTWWIPWKTFTCGPPSLKHPGPSKLRFDVTWFHPNTYCTNQTPWKPQEVLGPGCLGRFTSGILFLWGVSCWTMCVCFLFFPKTVYFSILILGFYFSLTHNQKIWPCFYGCWLPFNCVSSHLSQIPGKQITKNVVQTLCFWCAASSNVTRRWQERLQLDVQRRVDERLQKAPASCAAKGWGLSWTKKSHYEWVDVFNYPMPSMYGIFTYIWLMFMVYVGEYNVPYMDTMGIENGDFAMSC